MFRYGKVVSYKKLPIHRIGYRRKGINEGAKIIVTDIIEHPRSVKGRFVITSSVKTKFKEGDIIQYTAKNGRINYIRKLI